MSEGGVAPQPAARGEPGVDGRAVGSHTQWGHSPEHLPWAHLGLGGPLFLGLHITTLITCQGQEALFSPCGKDVLGDAGIF